MPDRSGISSHLIDAALALAAVLVLGPVLVGAVIAATGTTAHPAAIAAPPMASWSLVAVNTLVYPLAIGLLATALAIPAAWVARGGLGPAAQRAVWALALVPLMLPNYLAYAGWSLVRGPGTTGGAWLERSPVWLNLLAGRCLAVLGLALWAWPLAMLIVWMGFSRIPQSQIDAFRLHAGRARTAWTTLGLVRGSLIAAVALVALVMAGSPVPLHLAQAETLGVRILATLALAGDPGEVWRQSWPLLLLAVLGAWLITSRLTTWRPPDPHDAPIPRPSIAPKLATTLIWTAAVAAPLALFLFSLRRVASVALFWRDAAPSLRESAVIAAATGAAVATLALLTWSARGIAPNRRSPIPTLALAAFLLAGILPGVLVGSAIKTACNAPWTGALGDWLVASPAIVVLAHTARYGFIGIACGWWLAALEPPALADARRLAGGDTPSAWWRLAARPAAAAIPGIALAAAALSLHEIESTVQVYPPSEHPALAQRLLDALHYLRQEETSSAAVGVVTIALGIALVAAALLATAGRTRPAAATDPRDLP